MKKHSSLHWNALLGLALFAATALAAAGESTTAAGKPERPRIEVCFVLDTTGSMSGLIEGAKQKIWSIANDIIGARPTPEIRVGLIGYRDRGDEYVVKSFDLTSDIDAIYGHLQSFRAAGGGDMPESVNEALHEAVHKMSWSADRRVLKIIFLVGDAPPHMNYAGPKYPQICQEAVKKDLIINTVQCGNIAATTPIWNEIAKLSEGSYAAIAQTGNMAVIPTPMDDELADLNRRLGTTLVAYGSMEARRSVAAKQMAAESAPASVAADRLAFNLRSGGVAVQGEGELLDSLNAGVLTVESLKKDQLPLELRKLSDAELKAHLEAKQKERAEVQAQIQKLGEEREEFLIAERKRLAEAGKGDSFDEKVAAAIRAQAARKGIQYAQ